ncbi:MAG: class I SAM-dependent methyltransferase [Actinomycetota bacterium]|nr:class I SAM-dependent methyltransferase [Actinomycetota bacterium]
MEGLAQGVLDEWYAKGKLVGGIGSDPLERIVAHARNYRAVIRELAGDGELSLLDLGSGVGIPGLLLALDSPLWRVTLLDSMSRRSKVAEEFVPKLGLGARVEVINGRAEELLPKHAGDFEVVVARCFGPPPLLAELSVGFLRPGGILVVSEPPNSEEVRNARWPIGGLRQLGYGKARFFDGDFHFVGIRREKATPAKIRAYARMIKSPAWKV